MAYSEGRNNSGHLSNEVQFFLMEYLDPRRNFKKVSPFKIVSYLQEISFQIRHKLLRNGALLLITYDVETSKILSGLKIRKFDGDQVKVYAHPNLNCTRGVVYFPGLNNCTREEILHELGPQGVIDCKLLTPHNQCLFILKFNKIDLPSHIKVGYDKISVKPFIPLPLRCFDCLSLGRHAKCGAKICETCGFPAHGGVCSSPIKCVNCKEDHNSFSKNCKIYLLEQEIQRIRVLNKISYQDARLIVLNSRKFCTPNLAQPKSYQSDDNEGNLLRVMREVIAKLESALSHITRQENLNLPRPEGANSGKGKMEKPTSGHKVNVKRTDPTIANTELKRSESKLNQRKIDRSAPNDIPINTLDKAKLKAKMFG